MKFKPVGAVRNIQSRKGYLGEIELYPLWDTVKSMEAAKTWVTQVASLAYGNEQAKDVDRLWETLSKLGHFSCFEFIPMAARYGESIIPNSYRHLGPSHPLLPSEDTKQYYAAFKVKLPIFVARQFLRHRAFSYLELSRRYTRPEKVSWEFYGSHPLNHPEAHNFNLKCIEEYRRRLADKEPPELARGAIPTDAFTEFWVLGDRCNLENFFKLRLHKGGAQQEIKDLARPMAQLLDQHQGWDVSKPPINTNKQGKA